MVDLGAFEDISDITFHGSVSQQSAAAAAKLGAVATLQFWAFDRQNFPNGKPKGFHLSWSNGAPEITQAVQALAPLQGKAIEIGESKKTTIPCCCCCPPGFTDGSAENAAAEMRTEGFLSEASAAVAASGFQVQIQAVNIATEEVTMSMDPTEGDEATSSKEVLMFLIPGAAAGENPAVAENMER